MLKQPLYKMYVYKISDKLYRIKNGETTKDIWLGKKKEIIKPIHKLNILTEKELDFFMDYYINE